MCTGKAALPPGSASGPARWHWLWVPSPPPEWYLGLHSPPPTEPETLQIETLYACGRQTDRQTFTPKQTHSAWGGWPDIKQSCRRFSKENSKTVKRQKNANKHTDRWTYPVKVHKDGEGGCIFMNEKLEKEEKQRKKQRGRERQQHVIWLYKHHTTWFSLQWKAFTLTFSPA